MTLKATPGPNKFCSAPKSEIREVRDIKDLSTIEIDLIYLIEAVFAHELRHYEDFLSLPKGKPAKIFTNKNPASSLTILKATNELIT